MEMTDPDLPTVSNLAETRQGEGACCAGSCGRRPVGQPPPEKCDVNARANEPKPPRVTPPEPESDKVPDGERLDDESLLKKLLRDDDPPDQPRPALDEDPRGGPSALVCNPDRAALPRPVSQFPPSITPYPP